MTAPPPGERKTRAASPARPLLAGGRARYAVTAGAGAGAAPAARPRVCLPTLRAAAVNGVSGTHVSFSPPASEAEAEAGAGAAAGAGAEGAMGHLTCHDAGVVVRLVDVGRVELGVPDDARDPAAAAQCDRWLVLCARPGAAFQCPGRPSRAAARLQVRAESPGARARWLAAYVELLREHGCALEPLPPGDAERDSDAAGLGADGPDGGGAVERLASRVLYVVPASAAGRAAPGAAPAPGAALRARLHREAPVYEYRDARCVPAPPAPGKAPRCDEAS